MTTFREINTEGVHIVIVGDGSMRTIVFDVVGSDNNQIRINANASLTLGDDITIQGRTAGANGALIQIVNGEFHMEGNSSITGHINNATSSSGAVLINGSAATMTMSRTASVTGNRSSAPAATSDSAGGVHILNGILTMYDESSIRDNRHGTAANAPFADVYAHRSGTGDGRLNINGESKVGTLILNATETLNASFNVGPGFDGSVDEIDLRISGASAPDVRAWWTGRIVLTAENIPAALGRVNLGNFRTGGGVNGGAISDTHFIDNAGVLQLLP
jgi:hypothetical protein